MSATAETPAYAHPTDAGMDLTATSFEFNQQSGCLIYGTGIAVEIPEGYVGYIFPRSSVYKKPLAMTNCVGVIDSGYRGEIKVIFRMTDYIMQPTRFVDRLRVLLFKVESFCKWKLDKHSFGEWYNVGDKIAQLVIMPYPKIELEEATELSDSDRGTNGHGSTGK